MQLRGLSKSSDARHNRPHSPKAHNSVAIRFRKICYPALDSSTAPTDQINDLSFQQAGVYFKILLNRPSF